MRLLAIVEYDGTDFAGFQLQAKGTESPRTVQDELERAILAASGEMSRVFCSGRTDAGVHARGQVIHFDTESALVNDLPQFQRALNAHLPGDVVVHTIVRAPEGFHARYSARSRTYCYRIVNAPTPSPLWKRQTHFVRRRLDVPRMDQAAQFLVGSRDFVAFAAEERGATIRRLMRAKVVESALPWATSSAIWHNWRWCAPAGEATRAAETAPHARLVEVEIEANAFLRHMMRRIAGTLVRVGLGSLEPDDVASIVASRDKRRAGPTAPAAGLCLERVTYDPHDLHKEHVEDEDVFA